jgi:glycosyltransferase involved in cell wall biosynthesis
MTVWLASWYPNRTDPYNGDFIRRHALAYATQAPLTVIHVAKGDFPAERISYGNLTEWIIYVRGGAVATLRAYLRALRTLPRPSLLHVHVCMNAGLAALWAKFFWKVPYLVTEHYTSYIPGSPGYFGRRPFLYRFMNRLILEKASGIHSVSSFLLDRMEEVAVLPPVRVVIPNAVDTRLFRLEVPSATFRFVHISSFLPHKNVPAMLEAFAALAQRRTDWELVLIGPATARTEGNIRWTGELAYESVAAELRVAHALVLFSGIENQPCVISEALCCGVPVVAAPVGGIPEVIDASNGVLDASVEGLCRIMDTHFDRLAISLRASASHAYGVVGAALRKFK